MKKIDCNSISRFKLLIYSTICIIAFMIIIPIVSIKADKSEKKIDLDKEEVESTLSEQVSNDIYVDGDEKVSVYITLEDRIEEVDIEDYICGVVANEMQASFADEALKAQAIASRTYMISKRLNPCTVSNEADICDSSHCQVYSSKEQLISKWGEESGEKYWNKIKSAVEETKNMVLTYEGELVLYPLFFSTSSGKTESSKDVSWEDMPYLKSVESLGEDIAPKFTSEKEMALSELVSIIKSQYPSSGVTLSNISSSIDVLSRSDAGGVISIEVGNEILKGSEFRFLVGLNSTNFTYSITDNNIIFDCKGYGHGVGMSQWGANAMAKEGKSYEEILKHYYTGISIGNLKFN